MWRYNPNRQPPRKLTPHQAAAWKRSYDNLVAFVNREGHTRIPHRHRENGSALRAWIHRQREKWREGKLLDEHRELLEVVSGWEWGEEGVAQMPVDEEPSHGGHEWNFIHAGDAYRVMIAHTILLEVGAVPRSKAVRIVVEEMLGGEPLLERHLRSDGRTVWLVERALRHALEQGKLEQLDDGMVRAMGE